MNSVVWAEESTRPEGRPYRSHLHPACVSCRTRKSRCKTTDASIVCTMCQAHGTECVFPPTLERTRRRSARSRQVRSSKDMSSRASSQTQLSPAKSTSLASSTPGQRSSETDATPGATSEATTGPSTLTSPLGTYQTNSISAFIDFIAESEEGSSHVVSPAIADDDKVFQQYLSNTPYGQSGRMVRFHLRSNKPSDRTRPIVFSTFPRRGIREEEARLSAAARCEAVERIIEPFRDDLITLFFEKINMCFPIFDEVLFRRLLVTRKEKISAGLLLTLYGDTLIYWDLSPRLRDFPCPDQYSIWCEAEDALMAEMKATPGISIIITIILNISGRPSCHILGNGGLLGMAIAFANAFGLNRDPSDWNLSPAEKKFRVRIWMILVIYDRWCSLAYGTPPLIHRAQYDVPVPTVEDLCSVDAPGGQRTAASHFIALITLTDVLGHCLEHVYHLDEHFASGPGISPIRLDDLLTSWEDSLSDNLRREVIRGTGLGGYGAGNLRLSYLSVKLRIRRSQLDMDRTTLQVDDVNSMYFVQTRRVCEEIVDFVRELGELQCRDFWIPLNAYSLTSATTFLMRSALTTRGQVRNPSIKLARAMINALQSLRQDYAWDLADNCLANCTDLVEKIEAACEESSSNSIDFQEPMPMDMDFAALNGLFSEYNANF